MHYFHLQGTSIHYQLIGLISPSIICIARETKYWPCHLTFTYFKVEKDPFNCFVLNHAMILLWSDKNLQTCSTYFPLRVHIHKHEISRFERERKKSRINCPYDYYTQNQQRLNYWPSHKGKINPQHGCMLLYVHLLYWDHRVDEPLSNITTIVLNKWKIIKQIVL